MNKQMTFEQYADGQDWLLDLMYDMYWRGGLDCDECYEAVIHQASKEGVQLTDADTVDFEGLFEDIYNSLDEKWIS